MDENEEQRQYERSLAIQARIEEVLRELADLWGPDDTIEYVEKILDQMKAERDELGDDGEGS